MLGWALIHKKIKMNTKKTLHHEIAQSLGGSNEPINRIMLPEQLHIDWHRWTGNLTPTTAARFMMLMTIGWEGGSLDPELMKWYFKSSLKGTLDELYVRTALCTATDMQGIEKAKSAAKHTITHLGIEHTIVKNIQEALRGRGDFPATLFEKFPIAFLEFFETEEPLEAVERVFTHEVKNELAWVKPLKAHTRKNILTKLSEAKTSHRISLNSPRQKIDALLETHRKSLLSKQRQWTEAFTRTLDEVPEIGLPTMLWSIQKALNEKNGLSAA
jgi:hypothetical protein